MQFLLAPLWPLLKICFKSAISKLVDLGHNLDIAPFIQFTFDAVAGVASSFLFISCSDVSIVFSMISIDMIEVSEY